MVVITGMDELRVKRDLFVMYYSEYKMNFYVISK